jgi:hypothetical protein
MALRYFVNGGLNNSWNQTGAQSNWSLTSNGAGGQAVPSAIDDVIFDASSPACTLTGAATCLSFNASTYGTKLWALGTNNISVAAGNFTLGTGMTVSGTGTLIKSGLVGTLTSNGVTWSGSLQTPSGAGHTITFADDWTINGSMLGTTAQVNITAAAARIITINGSLTTNNNYNCTNITFVLNGTGISSTLSGGIIGAIINISPTAIITQAALGLTNCIFNIVAPFTGTYTSTGTISFGGVSVTLNNVSGITFLAMAFAAAGGQQIILNSNANTGNLTINGGAAGAINGAFTLSVSGNLIPTNGLSGTSTIQMVGSSNATISTGTIQNNLTINKSGVATVTFTASNTWGTTNRILTFNSNAIFTLGTTLTLSGSPLTIVNNSTPVTQFVNISIPANATLNINGATTPISETLLLTGGATFGGTHGWTTQNFTCTVANSLIILQNIVANPSAEYTVNGLLNLVGTLANRIRLEAAGRATFTGSIAVATPPTGSTMTVSGVTGTIAVDMTVSQASGQIPAGLSPFINDRPTIVSGASLSWVLSKSLATRVPTPSGTINLAAGYKAKFTLANNPTSSQVVIYVQTQDIDSSYGKTIQVTGSNGDDAATNVALFRTLNWTPLVATSGSVYYTFIN